MENLQFGQESKMAVIGPKVKKEEVVVEEVIVDPGLRFVYRDLAVQWPSSDPMAQNIEEFQVYLTGLLAEGWKIEKTEVFPRRPIGDMTNEFVIPVLMILTR